MVIFLGASFLHFRELIRKHILVVQKLSCHVDSRSSVSCLVCETLFSGSRVKGFPGNVWFGVGE